MARIANAIEKPVRALWSLFLAEGVIMITFGVVAIILPPIAGLAVAILLGWLLIASGLLGLVTTVINRHAPGFWWSLLSATVTLVFGAVLFSWPAGGIVSLSLALSGFLLLDGLSSIAMAIEHRGHFSTRWAWLLFNGVLDLIFAAIVLVWLPQSAVWALGLIVGIDMVFGGATLVAMAVDARPDTRADLGKNCRSTA